MRRKTLRTIAFTIAMLMTMPVSAYGAQDISEVVSQNTLETVSQNTLEGISQNALDVVSQNALETFERKDEAESVGLVSDYNGDEKPRFQEDVVYLSGKTQKKKLKVLGLAKKTSAVDWASSNPETIAVDNRGNIKALSEGNAEISAIANGETIKCTVWAMKLQLSRNVIMAKTDEEISISVLGIPGTIDAQAPVYQLEWNNSKSSVAKVTEYVGGNLYLKALAPGKTILRTKYNGTTYKCNIYVVDDLAKAANFREVKAGDIKPGRLFRSANPIRHSTPSFSAADRLMGENGVNFVVNMANKPKGVRGYLKKYGQDSPNYNDLVENGHYWANALNTAWGSKRERMNFIEAARNLSANEGPYLVHCQIGRDRTGFLCVLIEGLCNATIQEMEDDYMISWANYSGIYSGSPAYASKRGKFRRMVRTLTGEWITDPNVTIKESCVRFCKRYGMTDEEIDALINHLCN